MDDYFFSIDKNICDLENLDAQLLSTIEKKEKDGCYKTLRNIDNICDLKFSEIKDEKQFLQYYLKVIKQSWLIDINDFEIPYKKGIVGKCECFLKKIIWKILKFYTYRLFSQQIEFNSQTKNSLVAMETNFQQKISNLESKMIWLKDEIDSLKKSR